MRYHFDSVTAGTIKGWIVAAPGEDIKVQVVSDGKSLLRSLTWHDRSDVVQAYPGTELRCGFLAVFDIVLEGRQKTVGVTITGSQSGSISTEIEVLSTRYDRYLSSFWSHACHVARCFPARNHASRSDKDASSLQNSPNEMLTIANHLYILKDEGVIGDFAEFGCFKGFSSSLLSFACSALGIHMHVFDSFMGLPPSDSVYYKPGEFTGSLEEVRENIGNFGALDAVEFHKGYFSETVTGKELPTLVALFMDVDLQSSSKDVMSAYSALQARGAIFSHECAASDFAECRVIGGRIHPDDVILPIRDAFERNGAELSGRYLVGNTGAFWRTANGIPVADFHETISLVKNFRV